MRFAGVALAGVVALSLLLAGPARAQSNGMPCRWGFTLGVGAFHFSAVARNTLVRPSAAAQLRPSSRLGLWLALARRLGLWEAAVEFGWARGHVEAGNDMISIHDRSADMSRYRMVPSVSRHLTSVGSAEARLALAPTIDLWTVTDESRLRVGGEIRLALRVPLGTAVELENSAAVGLSNGPIVADDLDGGFEPRALRTVSVGAGLRVGL